jgi:hypothetical protein
MDSQPDRHALAQMARSIDTHLNGEPRILGVTDAFVALIVGVEKVLLPALRQ